MSCSKIVLLDSLCELDSLRDDSGALSIVVSDSITLNKKTEELSDLDKIVSDYSNTFELVLTSREVTILKGIQYDKVSSSKQRFRAYLLNDDIVQIDGFLYIDSIEERIFDGIIKVKAQIIGTHQSWKETFRANKLTSLSLGQIEWIDSNIFNLWQNNDSYQDTGSAIYPMLANFGESLSNASNDVCILDIRFIVYLKALIENLFCISGYKVQSEFFNSTYFRKQALYLLAANFGTKEKIQHGTEAKVSSSIDSVIGGGIVPLDTIISNPTSKFDTINYEYLNNTGQNIYDSFIYVEAEMCNTDLLVGASAYVAISFFTGSGPFLLHPIPELNRAAIGNTLNSGECFSASAVVDCGQVLRDNLTNTGYIQNGWGFRVVLVNAINPFVKVSAGAYAHFYTKNPHNFEQGDIFEIAKTLNDTFSIYDLVLDIKKLFNLRFRTLEAQKIVEIEPEPKTYNTYQNFDEASFVAEGFSGNETNPDDVIDITDLIDVCQFVQRTFPDQNKAIYYDFKFKDSSDNYSRYKLFGESNLELWENDTSENVFNVDKKEIALNVIEPTLNDFDRSISNTIVQGTYIPYLWENAQAEGSSDLPEAGSNLAPRLFFVYGWQTQIKGFDAIGFIYEGITFQFVPNIGQLFEIPITFSPLTFGLPPQNNVFRDNLSADEQEKNLVNTFYSQNINDDLRIVELKIDAKISDLFFKCLDIRKVFRIFSEKSSLMRFNNHYQLVSISKNINSEELANLILKPLKSCNNG
jgi:hypothetical protein